MKTITAILFLILSTGVCFGHDAFPDGSTDREHLSGDALKGYLHGHIYTPKGYSFHSQWGFWDYNPDVDNYWEKVPDNWEKSGCTFLDEKGKKLYDHDCYYKWIKEGNLKPTVNPTPPGSGDDDKKKPTVDGEITDDITLDDSPLLRSPNRKTGDPRICRLSKEALAFWRSVFSVESLEYPVIHLKYNPETGDTFFDPRPLNKPFRLDVVVKSDAHQMAQDGRCAAIVMFSSENRFSGNKNHVNWFDNEDELTLDLTGKTGDKWGAMRGNFRTYPHCYLETLGDWTFIELRIGNCVLWSLEPEADAPSAPSLMRHPKLTTMWSKLKQ